MGTGFLLGLVRPGRAADHSSPSSAEVLEELSYTSTPLWATTGHVTGLLYLYLYIDLKLYGMDRFKKIKYSYRSLNATVAQSRNCSYGINTMTELTNITTASDNNGVWQGMFQIKWSDVIHEKNSRIHLD